MTADAAPSGEPMTADAALAERPDTTADALGLLRELSRSGARKQLADLAWWLYLAAFITFSYGGWLVAAIVRALRHPPPPVADTPMLLLAVPAALSALALLLLTAQLWDSRWRGPVMVSSATADWLLDTPVDRARLLRPRYRASAVRFTLAGAAAGLVPAATMIAAGLGGGLAGSLRLAGTSMLSMALLAAAGTGVAAWLQARRYRGPRAVLAAGVASGALAVLAVLTAVLRLTPAIGTVVLWSGPWGWAAQGPVAMAGGSARLWPVATVLLGLSAVAAVALGDLAAPRVPAAVLRARARTMGHMSAAVMNLDARRATTAYRGAVGAYGRARLGLRPPLMPQLIVPWRDLTALLRAPARFIWSALLAVAAAGLGALAVRTPHADMLPLVGALSVGYLAAAGFCEGARLDGDDPRRSAQLPVSFDALAWWHAIVPCAALAVLAGGPAAGLAVATGHVSLIPLVAVTIAVLVGGALVSSYRGALEGEMFEGFETPLGHSSGITITLWYVTGPLLSIAPMIILFHLAVSSSQASRIAEAVVLAGVLTVWLGRIAARRARRLKSG